MIKLFREKRINDSYNIPVQNMITKVNGLNENSIINGNIVELTNDLYKYLKLKPLIIDFSDREVNVKMIDLPGSSFPRSYDVSRGKSYPCAKAFYTFSIKSGEIGLLSVQPNINPFMSNVDASIYENTFTIGYQTTYGSLELSDEIKKEIKSTMAKTIVEMEATVLGIKEDFEVYNIEIKRMIKEKIEKRKVEILKNNSQNKELNDL